MQTKVKNILVIRSATRIMNQTLKDLKQEFPLSRITVLAPESVREVVLKDPLVDNVLSIRNGGPMSVFSFGLGRLKNMRRDGYDMAVSLYNIDHGQGYSNIDILAWASGARELRGYSSRGTWQSFTGPKATKKMALEKTNFLWLAANSLATILLFTLITFGLIGEWCLRKLFFRKETWTQAADRQSINTPKTPYPVRETQKELTRV